MSIHHRFWLAINSDFFYVLALKLYGNRIYAWFIHADRFQMRPKLNATRSMLMIFNSIRASTFILINTYDDFRSSRLLLFCDVDDFYRQFA